MFPFIYVLMTRRTVAAYAAVLLYCRDTLALQPRNVQCDYERALLQSLTQVFPAARITSCLFHFAQVW